MSERDPIAELLASAATSDPPTWAEPKPLTLDALRRARDAMLAAPPPPRPEPIDPRVYDAARARGFIDSDGRIDRAKVDEWLRSLPPERLEALVRETLK